MADLIDRQAAIDAIKSRKTAEQSSAGIMMNAVVDFCIDIVKKLPSAQPQSEWNNHTVACLLAELFGDDCACNYNGIDEWLPEKCEVIDACPNPVGVACWEQFLKHREERRKNE